ncbi:MAG: hypothetical protein ACQERR_05265 [Pseudomonadota bacterium]
MGSAVEFYDKLLAAEDDRARARVIAEGFERLEERYPEVKELATQTHLSETELRLRKEIIEVEGRLQREIGEVRLEVERVRSSVLRWLVGLMAGQTAVIVTALFAIAGG